MKRLSLFASCLLLVGCATQPVEINSNKAFQPSTEQSVILIGQVRDNLNKRSLRVIYGGFLSGSFVDMTYNQFDVIAVSVPKNTEFYTGLIKTLDGYPLLEASIDSPKKLTPTKQGIYLYGTVIVKGMSIYVDTDINSKVSKEIITLAKKKYKNIFATSKPENF